MKKLLILANDTTYTYNLRDQVIERFRAGGYEITVAAEQLKFREELTALGCKLIDLPIGRHGTNPFADLALLRRYLAILREEKPSAVLTYNIKPCVYGGLACRREKTPYFPTITGLGGALEKSGLLQTLTISLYRIGVKGAACVFFQNERNRTFFLEHRMLPKEGKTMVVPGSGVNLTRHAALPYPSDEAGIHFFYIGRVMKEKGIDLYLAAAKAIRAECSDVSFHICGYCEEEHYLEILHDAVAAGEILYHDEQADLLPFYRDAHCIVLPSFHEGMSNVVLEAAAHARPAIAADRSGCREAIEDGKSGFLVADFEADSWIAAMKKVLSLTPEARREMGLRGREKMEREFDRKLVAERYWNEVEQVGLNEAF